MSEIYWLTRLDAIGTFLLLATVFGVVYIIVGIIIIITGASDTSDYDNIRNIPIYKWFAAHLPKTCWIPILLILLYIFTPTTKDMLIIYGVGGTVEYLQNNETAKQIPDKTLQCIDKLLEDYLNK